MSIKVRLAFSQFELEIRHYPMTAEPPCVLLPPFENIQGVFFHWYPPKKLKYGKPRLGESTLT